MDTKTRKIEDNLLDETKNLCYDSDSEDYFEEVVFDELLEQIADFSDEVNRLSRENKKLREALESIYNIDTMQVGRPTTEYNYKEESEEVFKICETALKEVDNEM